MITGRKILAIGAHPDDLTLGCYGTLLKLAEHNEIHALSLSGRETEQDAEFRAAFDGLATTASVAGMKPTHFAGINVEVRTIDEAIHDLKIDLVISHAQWDHHRDHRVVAEMTETACRRQTVDRWGYYAISGTPTFQTNLRVDIGRYLHAKLETIRQHVSMAHKPYMNHEFLREWHKDKIALAAGLSCVELFHVYRAWM